MHILQGVIRFFGITLPALMIGILVLIVLGDVLARNLFAASILWAHDLAIVLLAAAVWLGLAGAARERQLFGVSFFADRLPPRARAWARLASDILVIAIAAGVIRAAWAQISTARFTKFLSLGWPKWIVAALLAAGMALIILQSLIDIATRLREGRE